MNILERVVNSVGETGKHDVWCRVNGDSVELLINVNGKWIPVAGSGGGGGSCPCEKVLFEFDLEDLDKLSSQLKSVSKAASEGNAFNVVICEPEDGRTIYSSVVGYEDKGYGIYMYYGDGSSFFVYKSEGVDDFIVSVISRLQEDDQQEMMLFPGTDNILINSNGYLTLNVFSQFSESNIEVVAVNSDGMAMICVRDDDDVITGFVPAIDSHPSKTIYITEEELNYLIGSKIGVSELN